MAYSKVILNGVTLMDVTQKTVEANKLLEGYTALKNDGTSITGTYEPQSVELQAKSNINPTTASQTITPDTGYDGLSSVQINAMPSGSATTPATTITAPPTLSVANATGIVTASISKTQGVTPSVSAGYVASGTEGTITVSGSNTLQLSTQAATTITPTTSVQTAVASGKFTTGAVTVAAMPSGSATTPATTITANPTISVSASGLVTASVSKTQGVTPTVSAGYVSSGTSGTITVSGSNTSQLTVYNGEHHQPTPSSYTVTVSLTNPISPSDFISCDIYPVLTSTETDEDIFESTPIGAIGTASGSTTVAVDASYYGIGVLPNGNWGASYSEQKVTTTEGVSFIRMGDEFFPYMSVYSVGGNGTITINGIDYGD